MLMPMVAMPQSEEMDLDSIYMSYMSDSSKAQILKMRSEMDRIEQQRQEREEHQRWWYLVLAGCAVSAIIVTGGIFREVSLSTSKVPNSYIGLLLALRLIASGALEAETALSPSGRCA